MLRKILGNNVLIYISSRYLAYFIQFLNSVLIAVKLGPFFLGIWGFALLIIQYLSFGNLGIEYALNVRLSTLDSNGKVSPAPIILNAFLATILTCLVFLLISLAYFVFNPGFFDKYYFSKFIFLVVGIACINFFNVLYVNILRSIARFNAISVFQIVVQLIQLPVIFFFNGLNMINGLLLAMLAGHIISLFVFRQAYKIKLTFSFDFDIIRYLYKRGIVLLFYNISFYLLTLSTRSMVSYYFSVEEMGLYTFSSNIASAVILGIGTLEFVAFPKMINRLSFQVDENEALQTIKRIRKIYITAVYLVILAGLILYPLFILLFPKYISTVKVGSLLLISQLIISLGFGYSAVIIARGKEIFLAIQAVVAVLANIVLSIVIGKVFHDYKISLFIVPMIISILYYEFQVVRKGRQLLSQNGSIVPIFSEMLPAELTVPLLLLATGIILEYYVLFAIAGLLSFIILNYGKLSDIIKFVRTLIIKPEIMNISND